MCRSVPQMVVVVIRTIASVACMIFGFGLSSNARLLGPWKTRAFIVVMLFPLQSRIAAYSNPMNSQQSAFIAATRLLPA
jgi:hypothetical protein